MADQDRLAALLERVTRERRGEVDGVDPAEASSGGAAPRASEGDGAAGVEPVAGGEWLPPDPGRHRPQRAGPGVLTLPTSLRSVDLRVRPIAVIALVVVALVAAVIFGLRWWRAEQGSAPVPVAPLAADLTPDQGGAPEVDGAAATAAPSSSPGDQPAAGSPEAVAATPTGQPTELFVHVAGEVRSPGVVRLEPGARVQDAVDAAGGLGGEADTSRINLARAVADGERIWVPSPGEQVPEVADDPAGASTGAPGEGGGADGADTGGAQQININTADQAVLEELPGVGPVTAGAIVQWRTENGQFSSPDELLEVSGIGEATLEKLRPHVTL